MHHPSTCLLKKDRGFGPTFLSDQESSLWRSASQQGSDIAGSPVSLPKPTVFPFQDPLKQESKDPLSPLPPSSQTLMYLCSLTCAWGRRQHFPENIQKVHSYSNSYKETLNNAKWPREGCFCDLNRCHHLQHLGTKCTENRLNNIWAWNYASSHLPLVTRGSVLRNSTTELHAG